VLEDHFAKVERENHDLSRSIYEAAQLQRRLCGPRYCRTAAYQFASEIFPVRHLSGDFICVVELEGDLVFAIGDIAGKGLAAGMWFTHVLGTIRRAIAAHGDPAAALSAADRDFLATGLEFPLTTVFLARFAPATGELTYSNAGHPPALLIRGTGEVEHLIAGGPVLGAFSGASFVNGRTRLAPSDTLVAYSDGIAESRNESGVEFGSERLASVTRTLAALNAGAMLFSILAALETFAGRWHREDDIALAVLRRLNRSETDSEQHGSEGNGSERYAV
jgi:sigma-B regulation protein RsbU (phosphoserine phosphatase)